MEHVQVSMLLPALMAILPIADRTPPCWQERHARPRRLHTS